MKKVVSRLKFIPKNTINKINWNHFKKMFSFEKYDYCAMLYPGSHIRLPMDKSIFSKAIDVEFEGHLFSAPIDYDAHLTGLYGDYMTPPPPEKRTTGEHTITVLDLNKNYTEYLK